MRSRAKSVLRPIFTKFSMKILVLEDTSLPYLKIVL